MNTSAHVTSSCRTCWALGDFRSRVMLRLLRLLRCHWYGSSAAGCGGILCPNLQGSPFGGSTLMTSAPKSDRITAAAGAATKLEKSTTLSPEKMLSLAIAVLLEISGKFLHRTWNCGACFSRKAHVPSFLSSVPAHSPK